MNIGAIAITVCAFQVIFLGCCCAQEDSSRIDEIPMSAPLLGDAPVTVYQHETWLNPGANSPIFPPSTGSSTLQAPSGSSLLPTRPSSATASSAPSNALIETWDAEADVPNFRPQFFQGFEWSAEYLHDLGDQAGGIDQTYQEVRAGFGVPLGSLENILAVSPFFRTTHLNGPTTIDVPETLFDTGVALFHRKPWTPTVSTTVLVAPMVRSDFSTGEDAFRLFGLGLINWQANPQWIYSVGVLHLDREDVGLLPAIGFVWRPTRDWKLDGMLPRPMVSKRVWRDGPRGEAWASVGGSFGGNSWAVTRRRPGGSTREVDQLTLRDFRVFGQYEVIRAGRRGCRIQGGYAFGRSIEYDRLDLELDLDDALFVEARWRF